MNTQILLDPKVIADQARDELLASDGWFSNISVISADPGDIDTEINLALGQLGLVVLIAPVSFKRSNPNLRVNGGPFFDKGKVTIFIGENPTLNRKGTENVDYITAQAMAILVSAVLDNFAPAGINERFLVTDLASIPIPRIDAEEQPSMNIWFVEFTLGAGIGYNKGKIAPVTGVASGDNIVLSCTTPGAAIWFTSNPNGYPSPVDSTSALAVMQQSYLLDEANQIILDSRGQPIVTSASSFPIPFPPGSTLKTRAWRSGLNPTTPDIQVFTN